MTITVHQGDIPSDLDLGNRIAVDTEAMGLKNHRDRLCLVQLSSGDGNAHLVQIAKGQTEAPNLAKMLGDRNRLKLFHFARFDYAIIKSYLGIECAPLYCTKIASTLGRTYTDKHSLRELCRELLSVDLSKQQQSSDWGADVLTEEQKIYAANDVLFLHQLQDKLDPILEREDRAALTEKVFSCVPVRAELDLRGWLDIDIFAH